MKNKLILTVAFVLLMFIVWNLSFFGPSNYEECLLEKMKGQKKDTISIVENACENKFPYERKIYFELRSEDDRWSGSPDSIVWLGSSDDELSIGEGEKTNYKITKVKALFSKLHCDKAFHPIFLGLDPVFLDLLDLEPSDFTLKETFFFSSDEKISTVQVADAEEYKCMRLHTVWGILLE